MIPWSQVGGNKARRVITEATRMGLLVRGEWGMGHPVRDALLEAVLPALEETQGKFTPAIRELMERTAREARSLEPKPSDAGSERPSS